MTPREREREQYIYIYICGVVHPWRYYRQGASRSSHCASVAMAAHALPRVWPWLSDGRAKAKARSKANAKRNAATSRSGPSKVDEWYNHCGALLDILPLTENQIASRNSFPVLESPATVTMARSLLKLVPNSPAHSFQYKNQWKSLSVEAMATFYEDAALHTVVYIYIYKYIYVHIVHYGL